MHRLPQYKIHLKVLKAVYEILNSKGVLNKEEIIKTAGIGKSTLYKVIKNRCLLDNELERIQIK